MTVRNRARIGLVFALAAALLWAVTLGSSLLLPSSFPTTEILVGRYGVQLMLLLALVLPVRGRALVQTPQPRLQALRGSMMLLMPIAFTVAVGHLALANAWASIWVAPILGVLAARYVFGETLRPSSLVVAIVATLAAIVAHAPVVAVSISGLLAVAVAATSFGAFLALTRELRGDHATTGLFWTAACVCIPAIFFLPHVWQPITPRTGVGIVVMGTLWLAVLFCIDEALRRAPLVLITPCLTSEIVWARLLFRAHWTPAAFASSLVLFGCVAWSLRSAGLAGESVVHVAPQVAG